MPPGPSGFLRRFFGSAVSNAAGYAIGGAVQPVLEPLTQDLANEAWETHPVKPLGASVAARAAATGVLPAADAEDEAALTGINPDRFARLAELAADYPPSDTLLELLRRDAITTEQADQALARHGLPGFWRARVLELRSILPSPTDLIRMAVREVFTPGLRDELDLFAELPAAFVAEAAKLGIDAEQARNHWGAHWQLPSYEQLVDMLHRKLLSPAEFSNALRALDYAPVWRPLMEGIARRIPPISDVIRFAVRDAYDETAVGEFGLDDELPARFVEDAALHGQDAEASRYYWRAHWRPPSATQAFRMRHRDVITDEQLDKLLKVQDYAPFWRSRLKQITYLVPGRVDLRRMLKAGVIDRARTLRGYMDLGYAPDTAEILTRFAVLEAADEEETRRETVAELRSEYEGGYVLEAEFRQALEALGYPPDALDRLVALGDARRSAKYREKVVDALAKSYVGFAIDEAVARIRLAEVRVDGEAATQLIALWGLLRQAQTKVLTAAQVKAAYKKNRMALAEAIDELNERGYTDSDAELYLTT